MARTKVESLAVDSDPFGFLTSRGMFTTSSWSHVYFPTLGSSSKHLVAMLCFSPYNCALKPNGS